MKDSLKSEQRKEERRRLIFRTAVSIFSEKGYHAASVKEITDAAGISVGTYYLYFKNKEDLFEQLYDYMIDCLDRTDDLAVNENTNNAARKFARAITANLWAFQELSQLTWIMMVEAVGLNQRFEQKRRESNEKRRGKVESILDMLNGIGVTDILDTKIASIAYIGTFQVVYYWLVGDRATKLTDCAYPLAVYNLQALNIGFDHLSLKEYIAEMLSVLEEKASSIAEF